MTVANWLSQTRIQGILWRQSGGAQAQSRFDENWLLATTSGTGAVQMSRPTQIMRLNPPFEFVRQKRYWTRFLNEVRVADFQIKLISRSVHVFGPPPRFLGRVLEWNLSATLNTRALGTMAASFDYWMPQPPSRFLISYFRWLLEMPPVLTLGAEPLRIYFRGDLLMQFLAPAVRHLHGPGGAPGQWLEDGSPRARRRLPGVEESEEDLADTDQAEPRPIALLPSRLRFRPHRIGPSPAGLWDAIYYDSAKQMLFCRSRWPLKNRYRCVQLPQPLYRLVKKMNFLEEVHSIAVRGTLYQMNCAWWQTPE